jgi:Domain of unknown function (DUF1990)
MADLRILCPIDAVAELNELRRKDLNFDPVEIEHAAAPSWRTDDYHQSLVTEPPGPPVTGGSWHVARRLTESYEFVDPALVRAFYDPRDAPEDRTMLLEIDFWGLRIYAGVRSMGIVEETRNEEQGPARVWTWSYRTLEGHFEMGQIDYEVRKWLDSGEVEFRIHAVSRAAKLDEMVVRIGFAIFGRRKQVEFAHSACARIAELTSAVLSGDLVLETAPPADKRLDIRPLPDKQTAIEKAALRVRRVYHR